LVWVIAVVGIRNKELVLDLRPVEPKGRCLGLLGRDLGEGALRRDLELHRGAVVGDAVEGGPQDRVLLGLAAQGQQQGAVTFLEGLPGGVLQRVAAPHMGVGGQVRLAGLPCAFGPQAPGRLVGRAPEDDGRLGGGDALGAPAQPLGRALGQIDDLHDW
jgi:hypothetical protein